MKMSKLLIPVSLLALGSSVTASWAAEPASAPQPVGPVIAAFGPAGTSIPPGKFPVVLNYCYAESDGVRHGSNEISENIKLNKNLFTMKFRYGIIPGLDVRTATPIYDIQKKNKLTNTDNHQGTFGDTSVVLHKQIMDQAKNAPFSFAVDVGMILPTSNVSDRSNDALGNNAWGTGGGVGLTYFNGSHRIDQELNFYTFTEGSHSYRKANRFRSNTAWAYAANSSFDMGAESLFEWNGETEKNGKGQNDEKNEWYAGPKVTYKCKPGGFTAGVAAMFPMARWYEANTPSDGYRIEVRLTKSFDLF